MSDLLLNEGDLRVSKGDIIVQGVDEEVVAASISRRIRTPTNKYAIMFIQDNIVRFLDLDYGNDLQSSLSKSTTKVKSLVREQIGRVLAQETRITVNDFIVEQPNPYTVKVVLDYSYRGSNFSIEV